MSVENPLPEKSKRFWIVWEKQRRSEELASRLNCKLYVFDVGGVRRYPDALIRTVALLLVHRPTLLFVQNPSMVLAAVACIYGLTSGNPVVVDRHTTFLLHQPTTFSLRRTIFRSMSRFTLRYATLTIVTNEFLGALVAEASGHAFVLPDPIPRMVSSSNRSLKGKFNVLAVASYAPDEPIQEILDAFRALEGEGVILYISGNPKRSERDWTVGAPTNVIFTGFIPSAEYDELLRSVDAVLALTTADYCMLCGCYEAIAATKPLITSNKTVLRDYFQGAVFVDADPNSIRSGVREVRTNLQIYAAQSGEMKDQLTSSWNFKFAELEKLLRQMETLDP